MTYNDAVVDQEISLEVVHERPEHGPRLCRSEDAQETKSSTPISSGSELEINSEFLVWFDSPEEDPKKWSKSYRMYQVFLASSYTVLSPISSTSNVPAIDILQAEYGVQSALIANMMISAPMLGFLFAPSVYAPFSEKFGRKYLLQATNVA